MLYTLIDTERNSKNDGVNIEHDGTDFVRFYQKIYQKALILVEKGHI